ncbi:hypothetical protein IQ279_01955 [Streptomyces verrucosisporus]|uniref:DUF6571 family protein n=1 Tax=Streptomyces verrucosisporus TaxID=1695161 RepID=UPI0019CFB2A3|nr:DUF6571 family protein [Streptomyces verrucosisporus]MBN3928422.1 hypothetical protein [Streptomyces verrucosisporus]
MAKLTFTDLYGFSFSGLSDAVSDWDSVVTELGELADEARTGMAAKAEKADWKGENATVTKPFVRKTAKEFDDAAAQARSIRNILRDAHTDLKSVQADLIKEVEGGREQGIRVRDNGDGTVGFSLDRQPDNSAPSEEQRRAGGDLADRIDRLIARAEEIDDLAARALKRVHGGDPYNFGHAQYSSLDEVEAERAVKLAKLGPDMSDAQYREFNGLVGANAEDPEFSTAFYKGLGGPEEALRFYARMSIDGTLGDGEENEGRLALSRDLQRNMGIALATATDPDNKTHLPAGWGEEFRRLGTQQIDLEPGPFGPQPYGYQVLGGIMRYGEYDADFLTPIAEHITQLHHDEPTRFTSNRPVGTGDADLGYNPSGRGGAGYDPLTSVLEALGHSPEAAERFFTGDPTVYREDGTVDKGAKLGYQYFDEFLKEDFEWPPDSLAKPGTDGLKDALEHGPNALGHALEAAATGRAYDSQSTEPIEHTSERAEFTERLVAHFGEHPELIRHNENLKDEKFGDLKSGPLHVLRDSLGNITAEYIGDFQRSMYGDSPASDSFPVNGVPAVFENTSHVVSFLGEVGQDPDAYGTITSAQQSYTTLMVDKVFDGVFSGEDKSMVSLEQKVSSAVAPGAVMAGIMSDARADAVHDYNTAAAKDFNEAAGDKGKWATRTVELGTSLIPERVPVVGEVVNWLAEDITESVVKSAEKDVADIKENGRRDYVLAREAAAESAKEAVLRASVRHSSLNNETIEGIQSAAAIQTGNSHIEGVGMRSSGDAS